MFFDFAIGVSPAPLAPWQTPQPFALKTDWPSGDVVVGGGEGLVPIVSIAPVAVVAVVAEGGGAGVVPVVVVVVAGPFFGIGVFGMSAGGGAVAGAAVDGAVAVVAVVAVVVVVAVVDVVIVVSVGATVATVADDSVDVIVEVFVVSDCLHAARRMRRAINFFMSTPCRSIGR